MKILSIETSCDETAVSILEAKKIGQKSKYTVLGNALYSQIKLHKKYGGVYPFLAKREHIKNLPPLFTECLKEANMLKKEKRSINEKTRSIIAENIGKETAFIEHIEYIYTHYKKPNITAIGVTQGPGLEPALWTGITFAKALGAMWNIPVIPINHMEGHILSPLLDSKGTLQYPALALLISGGHTELVYSKKPLSYSVIGKTRDDALGEAYDKVARMLSLPYPGGPEISRLAEKKRLKEYTAVNWDLPRPMINTKDFDFSFSGLKTSVLYKVRDKKLTLKQKEEIAKEFEDAITDVIITKTKKAIELYKPKTLIIGGGVIANPFIRSQFEKLTNEIGTVKLLIPTKDLSTDNSVMIAIATFEHIKKNPALLKRSSSFRAQGNLSL
jgi:N6-L-threonylcarbamoyladenine synthase